ncbi:MAG: hypothetical protein ABSE86_32095 [Bryobacteraceae bacterium]|jgi:hypothetical protein
MVGIKEAVAAAVQFATSVLPPIRTADIRLEEVEAGDYKGQDVWLITLRMQGRGLGFLAGSMNRDFKTFAVHKETGEVLAMKIRELRASDARCRWSDREASRKRIADRHQPSGSVLGWQD